MPNIERRSWPTASSLVAFKPPQLTASSLRGIGGMPGEGPGCPSLLSGPSTRAKKKPRTRRGQVHWIAPLVEGGSGTLSRASSLVYGRSLLPVFLKVLLELFQRLQMIEVQRVGALDGVLTQRLERAENGRLNPMSALNDVRQLVGKIDVVAHA
jgi:hypothetical protein